MGEILPFFNFRGSHVLNDVHLRFHGSQKSKISSQTAKLPPFYNGLFKFPIILCIFFVSACATAPSNNVARTKLQPHPYL